MTPLSGIEQAVKYWREKFEYEHEALLEARAEIDALRLKLAKCSTQDTGSLARWTSAEDQRLIELWTEAKTPAMICSILIDEGYAKRSPQAIESRANRVGLKRARGGSDLWTPEMDDILVDAWAVESASQIARRINERIGVSRQAVISRAFRLVQKGLLRAKGAKPQTRRIASVQMEVAA